MRYRYRETGCPGRQLPRLAAFTGAVALLLLGVAGCSDTAADSDTGWALDAGGGDAASSDAGADIAFDAGVDGTADAAADAWPDEPYGVVCDDPDAVVWGESNTRMHRRDFQVDVTNIGVCRREVSSADASDTLLGVRHYVNNERGQTLREKVDESPFDGQYDFILDYTYSSNGHLHTKDVDEDADGEVDWHSTYVYDSRDLLIEIHGSTNIDEVGGAAYEIEYDSHGRRKEILSNPSGARQVYHYEDGLLKKVEKFYPPKTQPRSVHTFYYEQGLRARSVAAFPSESPNSVYETQYRYDCHGRLTGKRFRDRLDNGGWADWNTWRTYEYDNQGRLKQMRFDVYHQTEDITTGNVTRYFYDCETN